MVWKGDAARGLGGGHGPASPLPSLRVCGAWESPDCPICKLQSRLSASTSEIKDPSSCLVPSEPGLSSVQTLWHHGADCGGNLLLGCEKRGRLRQFSVKERKKQKERREHTTTKTVYSSRVAGGNPGTAEMLPVLGQGASYWEGLSLCFSSTAICLDGEPSEKPRGGGLVAAGCRKSLGLLLLCCPSCTCRAHTGAAQG